MKLDSLFSGRLSPALNRQLKPLEQTERFRVPSVLNADMVQFSGRVQSVSDKPANKPLKKTIYIVPHTHFDREWYRVQASFQKRLREIMQDVVPRLKSGELEAFNLDAQAVAFQDALKSVDDELEALGTDKATATRRKALRAFKTDMKQLVREGKLSIGPWFIQPDLFLVSGESLIRNLKKGMDYSEKLGVKDFVGYLPDPFGQPASMPMLMDGVGIDNIVFWRGGNPENTEFLWQGKNGSDVLVRHFPFHGYSFREFHLDELSDEEKVNDLNEFIEKTKDRSPDTNVILFPAGGDHMGAIQTENLNKLKTVLAENYADYDVKVATYPEFMTDIKERVQGNEASLQKISGHQLDNTDGNILQGVYSARLDLKQQNRQLEHTLTRHVEPLTAMGQLLGNKKLDANTAEVNRAWRELLLNQPHDSICGCSIDEVHVENHARYNTVRALSDDISTRTMAGLGAQFATDKQWLIVNQGDRRYSGPVKVKEWFRTKLDVLQYDTPEAFKAAQQKALNENPTALAQVTNERFDLEDEYLHNIHTNPNNAIYDLYREGYVWVDNVPPHGVAVVDKTTQPEFKSVSTLDNVPIISNGLTRVWIKPDGSMDVLDLKTGKQYYGIHTFQDKDDQGDSYNSAPVKGSVPRAPKLISKKLVESGALKSTYELNYELANPEEPSQPLQIATRVSLEAGNPQVLFETSYSNTFQNHKLQVTFPTAEPVNTVRSEGHFGIEDRDFLNPNYNELQNMPARDPNRGGDARELKTNTGAIQRFMMANGQMLTTEGLSDYEVAGKEVKLTLLRAFGHISKPDTGVRDDAAGPHLETPDGQMLHRLMTFRYAWQPTPDTDSKAYDVANQFYGVVSGEQGRANVVGEGTELDSLKTKAEIFSNDVSLVRWDNPNIVSSSIKMADSGDGLIVRVLNTTSEPQAVHFKTGFDYSGIAQLSMTEKLQKNLASSDVIVQPYDVMTLKFKVG